MLSAFLYGVILAFGLIIPLGIQNIFLFNQGATQKHFLHALPSVLAAFFCDTLLILLAVLGVSLIVLKLAWLKTIILLVGFFFLAYMGWVTWNSHPAKMERHPKPMTAKQQITFAMSVSLLNPHALLDSIGVIGTNALHFSHQALVAYTLGCILVSLCWFFGLSVAGHFLHRLDKSGKLIKILNKVSAIIIWVVAIYIAVQLVM
jgi:L-lysine exporter family protein LysE/ArgO